MQPRLRAGVIVSLAFRLTKRARRSCWLIGIVAALVSSCETTKEEELQSVAKDWCTTIRASQVMPVYPLTQDIQPGDVFLVQVPIEEQQKQWKTNGYLPLDNHLARLNPSGYIAFYDHSFPIKNQTGEEPAELLPLKYLASQWDDAPRAAFPTYSFSVKKGAGVNLALPISGVPVGLGLLGADAAEGSVSIGKARTCGIDVVSLDRELRDWVNDWNHSENGAFLSGLASTKGRKNYVRVVTRVYLTGELDVSLRDSSQRSGGLDAGVASPVSMLIPKLAPTTAETPQAATDNYKSGIDKLNEMLKQGQDAKTIDAAGQGNVGGSLRLTSATARAISMKETFDPPLVFGYLGFDCEIGPGGNLGPAVPTYAVVSGALGGEAFVGGTPIADAYKDAAFVALYNVAKENAATDTAAKAAVEELDALSLFVPASWYTWEFTDNVLKETKAELPPLEQRSYSAFCQWRASIRASALEIERATETWPVKLSLAGDDEVEVGENSTEGKHLLVEAGALKTQGANETIEAQHALARRKLADWFFSRLYEPNSK